MSSNFPRRRQGIRLSDRDLVKFNYLKNMEVSMFLTLKSSGLQ